MALYIDEPGPDGVPPLPVNVPFCVVGRATGSETPEWTLSDNLEFANGTNKDTMPIIWVIFKEDSECNSGSVTLSDANLCSPSEGVSIGVQGQAFCSSCIPCYEIQEENTLIDPTPVIPPVCYESFSDRVGDGAGISIISGYKVVLRSEKVTFPMLDSAR